MLQKSTYFPYLSQTVGLEYQPSSAYLRAAANTHGAGVPRDFVWASCTTSEDNNFLEGIRPFPRTPRNNSKDYMGVCAPRTDTLIDKPNVHRPSVATLCMNNVADANAIVSSRSPNSVSAIGREFLGQFSSTSARAVTPPLLYGFLA